MIIFIAGVFSGHILVKKIILNCCAEARFLLVKLCDLWPKAALHYGSFEGKKR